VYATPDGHVARALLCPPSMAVAALILHLDPAHAGTTVQRLARHPALSVGAPQGLLLPVAAESPDARGGRALFEELEATPGVVFVDVVMVDFSDEGA
jgi:hypothetical protein